MTAWQLHGVLQSIFIQDKARTLFATHYHVMNKMAEQLPNVTNYNIAVKRGKREHCILRKLLLGGTDKSYGIHVAKIAGMPNELITRAT